MEIEHCSFPDDLLYDPETNTWSRVTTNTEVVVGVTSLLSAIAGRLTSARLKTSGSLVARGRSLGTLESERFVGPIPSPFTGTVLNVNELIREKPRVLNDSPYENGWIATLKTSNLMEEKMLLAKPEKLQNILKEKIAQHHVRCFKAFPDHEMFEIGVECSAVLLKLNELVSMIPLGDVVHLVSDDPTAYVEMVRWTDHTGNSFVDWRTEGNLFHFIVRKTRSVPLEFLGKAELAT